MTPTTEFLVSDQTFGITIGFWPLFTHDCVIPLRLLAISPYNLQKNTDIFHIYFINIWGISHIFGEKNTHNNHIQPLSPCFSHGFPRFFGPLGGEWLDGPSAWRTSATRLRPLDLARFFMEKSMVKSWEKSMDKSMNKFHGYHGILLWKNHG